MSFPGVILIECLIVVGLDLTDPFFPPWDLMLKVYIIEHKSIMLVSYAASFGKEKSRNKIDRLLKVGMENAITPLNVP